MADADGRQVVLRDIGTSASGKVRENARRAIVTEAILRLALGGFAL